MRESPFRENARQPDPEPEEDTSEEWFAKLRRDADRRRRVVEVGSRLALVGGLLASLAFVGWAIGMRIEAKQKCEAAGGTYLTREGKCIAVREIHP